MKKYEFFAYENFFLYRTLEHYVTLGTVIAEVCFLPEIIVKGKSLSSPLTPISTIELWYVHAIPLQFPILQVQKRKKLVSKDQTKTGIWEV